MSHSKKCLHCQLPLKPNQKKFCCPGCNTAYKIINNLGFSKYYQLRKIKEEERTLKPETEEEIDITEFINKEKKEIYSISLMVQGLHCAACVWLIENILKKQPNVIEARINLSRRSLFLKWHDKKEAPQNSGNQLANLICQLGYKLLPFDQEIIKQEEKKYDNSILFSLAIAGFGAGNVMLFSFALWFDSFSNMGIQTKNLFHFFSLLIAIPAIAFSARPFFKSAYKSIQSGYPNMDLAISMAISLACITSFLETINGGQYVYFDSALMLTFFLLIGRYLDLKARKTAFSIASEFRLLSATYGRILENSKIKTLPAKKLKKNMILLVAAGEKIAADGIIIEGQSEINTSSITGESIPKSFKKDQKVFAGMINLSTPIKIKITRSTQNSLLSEIITLSEKAENHKAHYVRIADKLSKIYTPLVHLLALITFITWYYYFKSDLINSLTNATTVLIITCPCALALAIPIVQTIAISNLIKQFILVKSGSALEKIPQINNIIFDKTGSLTIGKPTLKHFFLLKNNKTTTPSKQEQEFFLKLAASLSRNSAHPISNAISNGYKSDLENLTVTETAGQGLRSNFNKKELKLGKKSFCQIKNNPQIDGFYLTSFIKYGNKEGLFLFEDPLKQDAISTIKKLTSMGRKVILLSGDSQKNVENCAKKIKINDFHHSQTPVDKANFLQNLKSQGKSFIMIGDGINDAPALSLADVSISFSKASDLSQNIADIIIQKDTLNPLLTLINSSQKSINLMKQNLCLALIYNLIAVPFAILGHITPLIAALSMSTSSLIVLFSSLRMNKNHK